MAKTKNGKYHRYMPLGDVLEFHPEEEWSNERKLDCLLSKIESPSGTVLEAVEGDFLSVIDVLDRINQYATSDSAVPDEWDILKKKFDDKKLKDDLLETLANIKSLEPAFTAKSKEIDKLALLMFLLGEQVATINNQDLMIYGVMHIRGTNVGGEKTKKIKAANGSARKLAYENAMRAAQHNGYKPTEGGLQMYLSSLGERYSTGVRGCEEIWVEKVPEKGLSFFDSQGLYSSSSVQKIKIKN